VLYALAPSPTNSNRSDIERGAEARLKGQARAHCRQDWCTFPAHGLTTVGLNVRLGTHLRFNDDGQRGKHYKVPVKVAREEYVDWVGKRVGNARTKAQGTPAEVPAGVSDALKELLADDLQRPLKPDDLRRIVTLLAAAMRGAE
jgi:hypothetical protein